MPSPQHKPAGLTSVLGGPFGLLWAGQTTSMLDDGVSLVAFTWQLAVQWHQPALLGLLLGARVLDELILGPVGWRASDQRRCIVDGVFDAARGEEDRTGSQRALAFRAPRRRA